MKTPSDGAAPAASVETQQRGDDRARLSSSRKEWSRSPSGSQRDLPRRCVCASYLAEHPPPDPGPALATRDPEQRLKAVLAALYGWYRETAPMSAAIQRDRALVPALETLIARTMDGELEGLADALAAGFGRPGRVHAIVAPALDFWTWRELAQEGLDDDSAAALLASAEGATRDA